MPSGIPGGGAAHQIEIDAGSMDRRAQLLAPVYNASQDEIVDWTLADTVWASVEPNYAQELNESGRIVALTQAPIQIRYRSDIDARWRVVVDGQTWEILGLVNVGNRRAQLQLTCKLVQ